MSSVFYRNPSASYPEARSSSGMYIVDATGKKYLDMSGGAAVSIIGHGNMHVIESVRQQMNEMAFAHTAFFTNAPQEALARRIIGFFNDPNARVYFSSGGSEANETAYKLAWQYWSAIGKPDKKIIISREHSYHGNTLGGLSVSGNPSRRKASAAPLLDWPRISPCYSYRYQKEEQNDEEYTNALAQELENAIRAAGAENVAAFICEPIVGASLGVVPASANYLQKIRQVCDQYNILLIFDEIMCGSGRTGKYFAHAHYGVSPDIVTLAKGIAGGYMPLAATVIGEKLVSILSETGFEHGHTYIGHALACAAGNAVVEVIENDNLLDRCLENECALKDALVRGTDDCPYVGDIRGIGYFYGIEFNANPAQKEGFSDGNYLAGKLKKTVMEHGLICYPGGAHFDGKFVPHILFAPPLIAEPMHFMQLSDKLKNICKDTFDA